MFILEFRSRSLQCDRIRNNLLGQGLSYCMETCRAGKKH